MQRLDLVDDDGYLEIMKTKLDPDSLGIVLLPLFLEEFFPEEKRGPDSFTLFHYNGLVRNDNSSLAFRKGEAVILEGVTGVTNNNQILETLQTKWRNLAIDWTDGPTPSIN